MHGEHDPRNAAKAFRQTALDELIDSTARAMTDSAPPPALRERVRERLTPSRRWWHVPAWQPALVAAALLIVVVGRALLGPPGEPDKVRPTEDVVRQAVSGLPGGSDPSTSSGSPRATSRGDTVRPTPAPPPLGEIEPLVVETLDAPQSVAVDLIQTPMPLTIDQLAPIPSLEVQ